MYKLSCEESHSEFEIFCERKMLFTVQSMVDGGKAGHKAALLDAVTLY